MITNFLHGASMRTCYWYLRKLNLKPVSVKTVKTNSVQMLLFWTTWLAGLRCIWLQLFLTERGFISCVLDTLGGKNHGVLIWSFFVLEQQKEKITPFSSFLCFFQSSTANPSSISSHQGDLCLASLEIKATSKGK